LSRPLVVVRECVKLSSVVMTSLVVVCTYTGMLVVISIGVALGVAVGVFLLFALIACHRRYVRTYGGAINNFRLY